MIQPNALAQESLFSPNENITTSTIIDDIEVQGLNHVKKRQFMNMIPFSIGDSFNASIVSKSISTIFQQGFFNDVKVFYKLGQHGNIIIVYVVKEKPWLKKITFKGNNNISTSTLKTKISISSGKPYDGFSNEQDTENLLNYYMTQGFIGTQVHFSTQPMKNNSLELVITIYEGNELKIHQINISGTNIIPPSFLKGSFEILKEPSLLGWVTYPFIAETFKYEEQKMIDQAASRGFLDFKIIGKKIHAVFSVTALSNDLKSILRDLNLPRVAVNQYVAQFEEALLKKDKDLLQELYQAILTDKRIEKKAKSDLNFQIQRFKIQIDIFFNASDLLKKNLPADVPLFIEFTRSSNSYYDIDFNVNEGHQYIFNKVDIVGNIEEGTDFFTKKYLTLSAGEIYNKTTIENFKNSIIKYYRDKGFFSVVIQDTPLKDDKYLIMGNRLLVQKGEVTHIEKMSISGNHKTESMTIDRELRIKEGAAFNQSQLLLSEQLLQRTGYFKNVNVVPTPGSQENLMDLNWQVEEQKTGDFQFGGGYGSDTGISVYGNIVEKNLLGKGIDGALKAQWGQYQKSLTFSFNSNYIKYIPIGWSISMGYTWMREFGSPRYDRDHDGNWDKVIFKNGKYYFIKEGDKDFYNYSDEDRTGNFNPGTSSPGSEVHFSPSTDDSVYAFTRYFNRNFTFLEVGSSYSFANFWNFSFSNGFILSRYDNAKSINVNNIYVSKYYTLKQDLLDAHFKYSSYLRLLLSYKFTDDYLSPTQGLISSCGWDIYGLEGGVNQFSRVSAHLGGYIPLYTSLKHDFYLVWASGGNISTTLPFFNGKTNLHYEYQLSFNIMEELRGWTQYLKDSELLGLGKISFGSELRASVPGTNKLIWGVLFFDAGSMSIKPATVPVNFANYFYSYGFGVRIDFASFPLRFYIAQRLSWDTQKNFFRAVGGLIFEFAISSAF